MFTETNKYKHTAWTLDGVH